MKKHLATLTFATVLAFTTSCSSQKNDLAKNPDLLFEVIEQNPEKFLQAVEVAMNKNKELAVKKRKQREEAELQAAFASPLNPEIQKDDVVLGPVDAPITLVTYSDFECPYCSRGSQTVSSLMQKYRGKIRFVYKHLPLSFHPHALTSAKYFEAIKLESKQKAMAFHDKVFADQSQLKQGEKFLNKIAREVGADMKRLQSNLRNKEVMTRIQKHQAEAQKFNMQGTPGFILNGIPVRGAYPAEYFVSLIQKLQEKGKITL
jgi:protein-disulfide isomerase